MLLSPFALAPLAVSFLVSAAAAANNGGFDQAATTDDSKSKDTMSAKAQSSPTKSASVSDLLVDTRYDAATSDCSGSDCTTKDGIVHISYGTNLDTETSSTAQGSLLSYNQWGFTGSQSQWSENTESVAASETVISGSTVTLATSNSHLTVSKSSASGLKSFSLANSSSTANGGSMHMPLGLDIACGWKRMGALVSVVALTVGVHCI